jgi:acetate kinase
VADPGQSDSPVRVLVLNFGSSSLKYELFDAHDLTALASGAVERIGPAAELVHRARSGREEVRRTIRALTPNTGLAAVMDALRDSGFLRRPKELAVAGHRVVHGGASFEAPVRVDGRVLEAIRATFPLAPLHNPASLTGIEVALALLPGVPQVAVFDTAFHRTLPPRAYLYALPRDLARAHGVRRYGFHGTSHRYVAQRAAALLGRPLEALNLLTLHLGNGASAAAIEGGRSVDTSMGMTPLEGLVMGTRSGDLDASVPLFLQQQAGLPPEALEEILERQSGLRGLCGASDMREVLSREAAGDESARLAVDLYCYRAKKYIGAYLAVLGRADALVFTAGVGEHSPEIRRRICAGLEPLGIALDGVRNAAGGPPEREIQAAGARTKVLVIATHEEREIARAALEVVQREAGGGTRAGP